MVESESQERIEQFENRVKSREEEGEDLDNIHAEHVKHIVRGGGLH